MTPPTAPFLPNRTGRALGVLLVIYVAYAAMQLDFSPARFAFGLHEGARLLGRMFPPDFARWPLLVQGLIESVQIAVVATVSGLVLSLPIGFLAARNMTPVWVAAPTRVVIALCRSFHPVLVAIIFVKAIGFGALPGILALVVASLGFAAKLFAEAIEEISPRQVEAVRATGARFGHIVAYGVLPQVMARFVGFALYQLDSNVRNSTMVGIVGAGGIGGTLFTAFQRFDWGFVSAILLAIIALVMAAELCAQALRRTFL